MVQKTFSTILEPKAVYANGGNLSKWKNKNQPPEKYDFLQFAIRFLSSLTDSTKLLKARSNPNTNLSLFAIKYQGRCL